MVLRPFAFRWRLGLLDLLFEVDAELLAKLAFGVLISERSVTGVRDDFPRAAKVFPTTADLKGVGGAVDISANFFSVI